MDELDDVACYADEIELNFQEDYSPNEEVSVSIKIIRDNKLVTDDINFRSPPKRKKMNILQTVFNRPRRPKSRHRIRALRKD